ncbi:M20 family metallo-hydrolase [Microscilla marina]|uniref:Acetylornithine deacetylase n=1 Tax=Microscilla marina ATCC 23134 TaxID=313606 RepID=A1ZXB0_MICM2|nr:M20 family metallo-hydrolase [Microscilla marina]EAY24984.1 acetylornithine deacetylase [Microscilla marina ATCC 23134]
MFNKEPYINLLKALIATPSFSREEDKTATVIEHFIRQRGLPPQRAGNNVWVKSSQFEAGKPVVLLNSHHDTVKPVQGWQRNPHEPNEENGTIFGLGSNDAGASLVSLLATFVYLNALPHRSYNLIYAATAEEEISGKNGIASILEQLGTINLGVVGEPTQMQMAIAEKGLVVIDGEAKGKAGHAARNEGENAIYKALQDIQWIQNYAFPKKSEWLGAVKATVTQIEAGYQHNVVPDSCKFVIDVRTQECYSNQEVVDVLQQHTQSTLTPRSLRLNSSGISVDHPIVQKGKALGLSCYGSPTLSDQALLPFTTIKIGVGDSARSHTANEYILRKEIEQGIDTYCQLLEGLEIFN